MMAKCDVLSDRKSGVRATVRVLPLWGVLLLCGPAMDVRDAVAGEPDSGIVRDGIDTQDNTRDGIDTQNNSTDGIDTRNNTREGIDTKHDDTGLTDEGIDREGIDDDVERPEKPEN
jgi:hypothetical protein